MKSTLGTFFSITYLLIVGGFLVYAQMCQELYCGLIIIVPLMPWPIIVEILPLPGILNSQFGIIVFVLLNSGILYFLGAWIEKFRRKRKMA